MSDDKTVRIEALKGSIKHWKEMRDDPSSSEPISKHCPLCQEYRESDCLECPVFEETGEEGCEGTPFPDASDAWQDVMDMPDPAKKFLYELLWREAAQKEIAFLERLLAEEA